MQGPPVGIREVRYLKQQSFVKNLSQNSSELHKIACQNGTYLGFGIGSKRSDRGGQTMRRGCKGRVAHLLT